MSKCKYNSEKKLGQQSRIVTCNEEKETEKCQTTNQKCDPEKYGQQKIKKSDLAICLQKGGEEKKEEKH